MKQEIKVEFSFSKDAEILDRHSEELREYERYFEKKILPEIREIERRKTRAREKAYQIHVSISA
jgi:hypothetical protein